MKADLRCDSLFGSGDGDGVFWIGFVGMELTAPWYRFMAVSNGMHGPGVDWVVEEMSIVVSIQKGTVGIVVAPWFQQTVVPETAAKS